MHCATSLIGKRACMPLEHAEAGTPVGSVPCWRSVAAALAPAAFYTAPACAGRFSKRRPRPTLFPACRLFDVLRPGGRLLLTDYCKVRGCSLGALNGPERKELQLVGVAAH